MPDPTVTPTPSPTAFPAFPTLFTEADAALLKDLEAKKKKMEELSLQKFSPEAWAKLSLVEQEIRETAAETKLPQNLQLLPVEWGMGIATPEQFVKEAESLEKEYAELARRQKVTRLLPFIIQTIRALALTEHGMIMDLSRLESTFQLTDEGFTEDEIVYIDNLARKIADSSPEEIASGEAIGAEPLSPENIAQYAKTSSEPRYVLATIALSQNISDYTAYLKGAYKARVAPTVVEDILGKYKEDVKGVTPESAKEAAAISVEEGKPIVVSYGTERAEARIKPDNTVWDLKGNVMGYKLPESDKVYGFNLVGQPTLTIEAERNTAVQLLLAFYKSIEQIHFGTMGGSLEVFPNFLLTTYQDYLESTKGRVLGTEDMLLADTRSKEIAINQIEQWKGWLRSKAKENQDYYNVAIRDNPVFMPDLNWEKPYKWDFADIVGDPGRLGYTIVSNAPVMILGSLLSLGTATAVTVATAPALGLGALMVGAVAGAGAAFLALTPMQMSEIHDEYLANGGNEDDADKWGVLAGTALGLTEIVPDIFFAKTVTPAFMRAFKSNLLKSLTKEVAKRIVAKSVGRAVARASWDAIRQVGMEVIEEMLSTLITNATIKTVNEQRGYFDNMEHTIISTTVSMFLRGAVTGVSSYSNIMNNFTGSTKSSSDAIFGNLIDNDVPKDLAEKVTIAKMMETKPGEVAVMKAISDEQAKVPDTKPAIDAKVAKFTEDITELNKRIANLSRNVDPNVKGRWVDRLESLKTKKEAGDINVTQEMIDELDAKIQEATNKTIPELKRLRKELRKNRDNLRKASEVAPQVPTVEAEVVTPEVTVELQEGYKWTPAVNKWLEDFKVFSQKVSEATARREPNYPIVTEEDLALWGKDWKAFSRKMGYTEEEISDFERYLQLAEEGKELGVTEDSLMGVMHDIKQARLAIPTAEATEPGEEEPARGYFVMPKLLSQDEENKNRDTVLKTKEAIVSRIRLTKEARNWQELAKTEWLDTDPVAELSKLNEVFTSTGDYSLASVAMDQIEGVIKARQDSLRKVGLSTDLALNDWDELSIHEKELLAINSIPEGSLNQFKDWSGGWKIGFDIEYYFGMLEDTIGLPLLQSFRRIKYISSAISHSVAKELKVLSEDPVFHSILRDEAACQRVREYIHSKNLRNEMPPPPNITPNEIKLATAIEDIFHRYEPKIRFVRVMDIKEDTIEAFMDKFKDAVKDGKTEELEMALRLKLNGTEKDLWDYLHDRTWGVIGQGYFPLWYEKASLIPGITDLGTVRGEARFRPRQVTYSGEKAAKTLFQEMKTYMEQVESQYQLRKEMEDLNTTWELIGKKFSNMPEIEAGLREWTARLQGIPSSLNWYDRLFAAYQIRGLRVIFWEPVLFLKNLGQALILHPDRIELFRLFVDKMPLATRELGKLYYQTFVGEELGINQDLLHMSSEWDRLNPLFRLAEKTSAYGWSDFVTRFHSFMASLNKVQRATTQYKEDGDVKKWLSNSGAIHLNQNERNYVLSHYLGQADSTFDMTVEGLRNVSGADMANFYVAQRIADMTNFAYKRSMRGIVEMGAMGRTFYSLFVYPRGMAQRMFFQAEKVKKVFSGEATWEEARSGFEDILKISIASSIYGALWMRTTGQRKNPYDPLSILVGWQAGGLYFGLARELTEFGFTLVMTTGVGGEEAQKNALNNLPTRIAGILEVQIPFYKRLVDLIDDAYDVEGIDKRGIREIRSWIDKNYTPEELDDLDRTTWEKITKGLLGTKIVEPDKFEKMQEALKDSEDILGILQDDGSTLSMSQFGNQIKSLTKGFADYTLSKDYGFSDKVLFYLECLEFFEEYDSLPSTPASIRTKWRLAHPEAEAMLILWGKIGRTKEQGGSVFTEGSEGWKEVSSLISIWSAKYGISEEMLPKFIHY